MRELYKAGATPQEKMLSVNQKFGNTGIKNQQGTTRQLYDTLSFTGAATVRFFEDSASRNFPLTNTGSDGNKLGVGETMVVSAIQFSAYIADPMGNITLGTLLDALKAGELNLEIANQRVIKNLALSEGQVYYNESESNDTDQLIIYLETEIVIPPLLNYVVEVRFPDIAGTNTSSVRCDLIGAAGIIAPRTTF